MGIIKKYKIIYERNIIISDLIFKANRGKKPYCTSSTAAAANDVLVIFSHVTVL